MKENSTSSFSKIALIFIIGISIYYAFKVTSFKKEIRSNNETNTLLKDSILETNFESDYYHGIDTMAPPIKDNVIDESTKFINKSNPVLNKITA